MADSPSQRKLLISIAFGGGLDARKTLYIPREVASLSDLSRLICAKQWSPIIYRENKRSGKNFYSADFIALDVDGGAPLSAAIDAVKNAGVSAVIGTTRSHMVDKNGDGAKDRYRIIFPAAETCRDAETYRWTLSKIIPVFAADRACRDLARFFYPCIKVVFIQRGKLSAWEAMPEPEKNKRKNYEIRERETLQRHIDNKTIPKGIVDILYGKNRGFSNRHNTILKISYTLGALGYDLDAVQSLMRGTSLVEVNVDQPNDFERTSRDGWREGKRKWDAYRSTGSDEKNVTEKFRGGENRIDEI